MPGLLTANTNKEVVTLLGFHTKGDGGGGEFFWDSTANQNTHNGGTIIDPTNTADLATWDASAKTTWFTAGSGSGCWKRVNSEINVQSFGTKGDAVEIDTASIQGAIDYAETLATTSPTRGAVIFIPRGQYLLTSTLTIAQSRVSLKGEGRYNTVLLRNTDYGRTILVSAGSGTLMQEINITDLLIRHDPSSTEQTSTSVAHIQFQAVTHGSVRNCSLSDGYRGVLLSGCVDIDLDNLSIFGSGSNNSLLAGIHLDNLSTAGTPLPTQIGIHDVQSFGGTYGYGLLINACEQVNVSGKSYFGNCWFHNVLIDQDAGNTSILDVSFGDDVYIDGTLSASSFDGSSVQVTGANGDGSVDINGLSFTGTTIRGQSGTSKNLLVVDGTARGSTYDQVLHNLLLHGCSLLGADDSSIVLGGGTNLSLKNNVISGTNVNDATSDTSGIDVQANCDRVHISGNTIGSDARGLAAGKGHYGIKLRSGATNLTVVDNDVVFNVTAAILDSSADATSSNYKLIANNRGFNPGSIQPSVPSSTTVLFNPTGHHCFVSIFNGTVSDIKVDGATMFSATGVRALVSANSTITLTYSSTPSWKWWRMS